MRHKFLFCSFGLSFAPLGQVIGQALADLCGELDAMCINLPNYSAQFAVCNALDVSFNEVRTQTTEGRVRLYAQVAGVGLQDEVFEERAAMLNYLTYDDGAVPLPMPQASGNNEAVGRNTFAPLCNAYSAVLWAPLSRQLLKELVARVLFLDMLLARRMRVLALNQFKNKYLTPELPQGVYFETFAARSDKLYTEFETIGRLLKRCDISSEVRESLLIGLSHVSKRASAELNVAVTNITNIKGVLPIGDGLFQYAIAAIQDDRLLTATLCVMREFAWWMEGDYDMFIRAYYWCYVCCGMSGLVCTIKDCKRFYENVQKGPKTEVRSKQVDLSKVV